MFFSLAQVHLSYLKTVESFPVLLLIFSRWDQHSTPSRTNYFPLFQRLTFSCFPTLQFLHTCVLNVLQAKTLHISGMLVLFLLPLPVPFPVLFSLPPSLSTFSLCGPLSCGILPHVVFPGFKLQLLSQ